MNLYLIVVKPLDGGTTEGDAPPWTLNTEVFESQDKATAWAEANLAGQTWRVVMVASSIYGEGGAA